MTLPHHPWHRESDQWSFLVATDAQGAVVSAYIAQKRVPPGEPNVWEPCTDLPRLEHDLKAGGWHAMGGHPYDLPPSDEGPE